MDNPRLYLWIGLALLAWMNVIQWNRDYGAQPAAATSATSAATPAAGAGDQDQLPAVPSAPTGQTAAPGVPGTPSAAAPATAAAVPRVHVVTDVLDLEISLQGGDLVRADLLKYPRDKHEGSPPVRLFDTDDATYHVARTGLRALNGAAEPTHLAMYASAANEYRMAPGAQELRVPITWTDGQGVTVTKTYVFKPGRYDIQVLYDVDNRSANPWSGTSYVQIARHIYSQKRSMFDVESYAYRGPAIYDGKSYKKLDVTDEEEGKFAQNVTGGWIASMQHHFVTAAVPPAGEEYHFTLGQDGSHVLLTYRGPLKSIPSGTTGRFSESYAAGGKWCHSQGYPPCRRGSFPDSWPGTVAGPPVG
jgi:YidC/Oxa1 family membrane protein insertase